MKAIELIKSIRELNDDMVDAARNVSWKSATNGIKSVCILPFTEEQNKLEVASPKLIWEKRIS